MKRWILSYLFLLAAIACHGQLRPPQQTDTLYIASVKYNFADIRPQNWPCGVIYKSTTSFRIGDDEFTILKASKHGYDVEFVVTDKVGKDIYALTYKEDKNDITVVFSGYEFICRKIPDEDPGVTTLSESEGTKYSARAVLKGRSTNGTLPTFFSTRAGNVVVDIWVDNYGIVQKAVAGVEGTTITDKKLWDQARLSAMKTSFNMSANAPAMQKGTITYFLKEDEQEEEAIPFQLVEEKPNFQGGDASKFSKWVDSKLIYPEIAKENGVQGRVTLQFTVEKDGSVSRVRVLRGVDPSLDKEAVRLVSMSPEWNPGKNNGRVVPVTYTFPVIFQLR